MWERVKLSDVCELVQYGYTTSATSDNTGVKFLRITDIVPEFINWDEVPFCEIEEKEQLKYKLYAGDIVIARTGATVGYAKLIKNTFPEVVFASYLVRVRPRNTVDSHYIGYVVESDVYKEFINCIAGGAAQPNANAQDLISFSFPLPPLPLQRQVAAVLGRYDALLENYQGQVAALEGLAQELYREWFVRGRCPGAAVGDAGELPAGWRVVELSSMSALIQRGITPSYDDEQGEILCLNQRCIRDNKIDYSTGRLQTKIPGKKVIHFGDVLINSTGEGTLGRTAQVYKMPHEAVTIDTHVTIARPAADIPVEYYGFLVISQEDYYVSMALGATGQTELSREAIGQAKVLRPTQEAMQKFSQSVAPMKHKIINLLDQMDTLRATRDALLPRLLSGQLVPAAAPVA